MITNSSYHKDNTHISKSGLDLIEKAPALYYEKYLKPKTNNFTDDSNEAFLLGSGFHTIILEPHLLVSEYVVIPKFTGVGSKYKLEEFKNNNPNKKYLSYESYVKLLGMRDSVLLHPIAKQLLNGGVAEKTFTWIDENTRAKCKCRPDKLNQERKFILDLKSTEDASDRGFRNSAIKYRYDVQSAFYTDGLIANNIDIEKFIFIAVEKKPPYLVNIFFSDFNTLNVGREKYNKNLNTYMDCILNEEWEGYGKDIKPLGIEY